MTQKALIGVSFAAMAILLSACSGGNSVREALGMGRNSPDEFTVYQRAPLVLPPDYALRPPRPGEPRPQETAPRQTARNALFSADRREGYTSPETGKEFSRAEESLLIEANAVQVDGAVRDQVDQESTVLAREDGTLTEAIMFWDTPPPFGTVVDPNKEYERIRTNQAEGKPVTEGETPIIERREKGILEGVFN
ncbi:MAG: DUF3035 domain-containing protein [Magnetospiraceae bacterium]